MLLKENFISKNKYTLPYDWIFYFYWYYFRISLLWLLLCSLLLFFMLVVFHIDIAPSSFQAGCEPVAFSFLLTVLQMRHWQEMSQEPTLDEREVFRRLALLYQTLLVYQAQDGGFKYYRSALVLVTCLSDDNHIIWLNAPVSTKICVEVVWLTPHLINRLLGKIYAL